jgi:hypothetical protein
MNPPPDPQDALLEELTAYYNADELPLFIDDGLLQQGDHSARRLVHVLGDRAPEAANLLRELAADPAHPLFERIGIQTMYDWNGDSESWARFQQLAGHIADGIDAQSGGR